MNFVIPMAGRGKRFLHAGYDLPKMLIEVRGKTLLQWSLDSLPLKLCTNLVFVGLKEHEEKYHISAKIKLLYGNVRSIQFIFLERPTGGQAETVLKAENLLIAESPVLIFNIDTYFKSSTLERKLSRADVDGVLGAFNDNSDRYSYAALDDDGNVSRVVEKEPISTNALTGLYHFKQTSDYLEAAKTVIINNEKTKGEFYIAPLYNKLIEKGRKFILDFVEEHHILGTPEELSIFKSSYRSVSN